MMHIFHEILFGHVLISPAVEIRNRNKLLSIKTCAMKIECDRKMTLHCKTLKSSVIELLMVVVAMFLVHFDHITACNQTSSN